jgi:hypothetical protein
MRATSESRYGLNSKGLFYLAGLWVLSVILVNPAGEFPLADDWIYLDMLKHSE